ncbi:MAG: toll/interleukin-1 receptor domain-containing protein [Anaerolineae bacterium]|nr:toll/interleukin-1 receptor domain-containing protein [Anaerolineae bacterium]
MNWQIFLSYSRVQYYLAEAVVLQLQKREVLVWFDVQQLEPGSDWQQDIQNGLDQSGAVLLLASRAALDSPYVEREWRRALELGHPVIVALVERVRLPRDLRGCPIIDCRGDFAPAVDRLHRAILNPAERTPAVGLLPRFPRGVWRAARAMLLDDVVFSAYSLLNLICFLFILQQVTVARLVFDLATTALRINWRGVWPELAVAGVGIGVVISLLLSFGLRTRRLFGHHLYGSVLSGMRMKQQGMLPFVYLVVILASGYLPPIANHYKGQAVQPLPLLPFGLLLGAGLGIFVLSRLQPRLMPALPDEDLMRWARIGGLPDTWRLTTYDRSVLTPKTLGDLPRSGTFHVRVLAEAADKPVVDVIHSIITRMKGTVDEVTVNADYDLLILSHVSSRRRIIERLEGPENVLGVIVSRCNIPSELGGLQLIDYSHQNDNTLLAALNLLLAQTDVERSRLQPYLMPVNLKQLAPPKAVQRIANTLLSLFVLTLVTFGLTIWQREQLTSSDALAVGLAVTALLLLVSNQRARSGRLLLPCWLLLILALLPFLLTAVFLSQLPPEVLINGQLVSLYPLLWIILLVMNGVAVFHCAATWWRSPDALGKGDALGLPTLPLNIGGIVRLLIVYGGVAIGVAFWMMQRGSS